MFWFEDERIENVLMLMFFCQYRDYDVNNYKYCCSITYWESSSFNSLLENWKFQDDLTYANKDDFIDEKNERMISKLFNLFHLSSTFLWFYKKISNKEIWSAFFFIFMFPPFRYKIISVESFIIHQKTDAWASQKKKFCFD